MTSVSVAEGLGARFKERALDAQRRRRILQLALGIGFPLALILLWQLAVGAGLVDRRFFPPPSRIVAASVALMGDARERGVLGNDIAATLWRIFVGYGLGAVVGTIAGIAMALSQKLRFALGPLVNATYPTPKLAIFPLMIVIFGLDDSSKIALIALGVFYMTCMSTLSGVLYSNPIFADVATAFRFPAWTRWTKVVVPAALPAIVTGLKLGLGQALILVVSTEMISGEDGIGHFIWESWQVLNIPRMFLGLVIVALSGGAAMLLGDLLERKLTPWAAH
jgi:ABC-type nitrate/sulfonate/bicarbonate transport system permease component